MINCLDLASLGHAAAAIATQISSDKCSSFSLPTANYFQAQLWFGFSGSRLQAPRFQGNALGTMLTVSHAPTPRDTGFQGVRILPQPWIPKPCGGQGRHSEARALEAEAEPKCHLLKLQALRPSVLNEASHILNTYRARNLTCAPEYNESWSLPKLGRPQI